MPSTATVATVAGPNARRVQGLAPLDRRSTLCGPAATCSCAPADNFGLHRLVASAPAASVLVCDAGGDGDHGYFGDLLALEARGRGHGGLVIDGAVRDSAAIRELGFPVFHRGTAPAQAAKSGGGSVGETIEIGGVAVAQGDVVVADGDAVLVVAAAHWPDVAERAEALEAREQEIRAALERGERLGDLLGLDLGGGT
ncbi:MAG TPA: RraA family protein [Gaiellaceae bacterium]|nr:RraA family protein [Gaiellaceae bacterium]